jgi:hypothetical protein
MKLLAVIAVIGVLFSSSPIQLAFWLSVLIVPGLVWAWFEVRETRLGESYREFTQRRFYGEREVPKWAFI